MIDGDCQSFVADCHVRAATDLLRHSWDPVVLSALRAGAVRRSDLLPKIGGISDKSLTESLRRLQAHRLVERQDEATATAIYGLTELGESFANGPLLTLAQWVAHHHLELAGPDPDAD